MVPLVSRELPSPLPTTTTHTLLLLQFKPPADQILDRMGSRPLLPLPSLPASCLWDHTHVFLPQRLTQARALLCFPWDSHISDTKAVFR